MRIPDHPVSWEEELLEYIDQAAEEKNWEAFVTAQRLLDDADRLDRCPVCKQKARIRYRTRVTVGLHDDRIVTRTVELDLCPTCYLEATS